MVKKYLIAIIILIAVFLFILFFKNILQYYNNINIFSHSRIANNYCLNVISIEQEKLIKNKSFNINENNPKLNTCVDILESSIYADSLISVSYYHKIKAIKELEYQNFKVKKIFAYDKYFLKLYLDKYKQLKEIGNNKIKEEYPNPYEGRETPLYINLNETYLLEKQKIILNGLIYEYCLFNEANKISESCYNFFNY